jgi:hypothetical protein
MSVGMIPVVPRAGNLLHVLYKILKSLNQHSSTNWCERETITERSLLCSIGEQQVSEGVDTVGQKDMTERVRNGDDRQKTDQKTPEPVNNTNTDIVKKGSIE